MAHMCNFAAGNSIKYNVLLSFSMIAKRVGDNPLVKKSTQKPLRLKLQSSIHVTCICHFFIQKCSYKKK